jgi:hypothetical protein
MEDPKVKEAREEAASAIKLAHQMTEILGWLIADMRAAQVLRPQTATSILQLLSADDHSPSRSFRAKARLREQLSNGQTRMEQEMKKDEPYRSEGD